MESKFCENRQDVYRKLRSRRVPSEVYSPLYVLHVITNFRDRSIRDVREEHEGSFFSENFNDNDRVETDGEPGKERTYRVGDNLLHWSKHQMFSTYTFYCSGEKPQNDGTPISQPKAVTSLIEKIPGVVADTIALLVLPTPSLSYDEFKDVDTSQFLDALIKSADTKAKKHEAEYQRNKNSSEKIRYDHERKAKSQREYENDFRNFKLLIEAANTESDINRQRELRDEHFWSLQQTVCEYRSVDHKGEAKRELGLSSLNSVYGSYSISNTTIWTPFRIDGDAPLPFLIYASDLHRTHLRRVIRSTLDMWTYSILILHLVRAVKAELPRIHVEHEKLRSVLEDVEIKEESNQTEKHLEHLLDSAERIQKLYADIGGPLEAVSAYAPLVEEHLRQLDLKSIPNTQHIETFIKERVIPEARFCAIVASRLERLLEQNTQATDLVNTKVDLAIHIESKEILKSLDKNSRTNIRLQTSVEFISILPLTYYAINLIYGALGTKLGGWGVLITTAIISTGVAVVHRLAKKSKKS